MTRWRSWGARTNLSFIPRTPGNLMHNRVPRARRNGRPDVVQPVSQFHHQGLTSQAQLAARGELPKLAELFQKRRGAGRRSRSKAARAEAGWSEPVKVRTRVRVFFAEPDDGRLARTGCQAVEKARQSVIFCLFSPTGHFAMPVSRRGTREDDVRPDQPNRQAKPDAEDDASTRAIAVYHRSRRTAMFIPSISSGAASSPGFGEMGSIRTALRDTDDEPVGRRGGNNPRGVHSSQVRCHRRGNRPSIDYGLGELQQQFQLQK